jgi:hypothetical protein
MIYLDVDRVRFDRIWAIGTIHIRAEMEFRAHSKSYLQITTGNFSSFQRTYALSPKFI